MSTIEACVLVNSIFKSNLSDSDIKKNRISICSRYNKI